MTRTKTHPDSYSSLNFLGYSPFANSIKVFLHEIPSKEDYICQRCRKKRRNCIGHHIIPQWCCVTLGHPELRKLYANGMSLCMKCHEYVHIWELGCGTMNGYYERFFNRLVWGRPKEGAWMGTLLTTKALAKLSKLLDFQCRDWHAVESQLSFYYVYFLDGALEALGWEQIPQWTTQEIQQKVTSANTLWQQLIDMVIKQFNNNKGTYDPTPIAELLMSNGPSLR